MKQIIIAVLLCATMSAYSQIQQQGTPYNWTEKSLNISEISSIETEVLDMVSVKAEDLVVDQYKETPYRFGIEHTVDINFFDEAIVQEVEKGDQLYRMVVSCPEATSINFLFSEWSIPEGATVCIYNDERTEYIGMFNHLNNKEYNSFATGVVHDDKVIIEYYQPYYVETQAQLQISTIVHGYRTILNKWEKGDKNENFEKGPFGNSGSCNMNVNCPDGADWQDEKRGVALILNGGNAWCTGSLVNTTNQDGEELFLTAAHCDANESNWVFYFNHESSTCNGTAAPTNQSISGATQLVSGAASDYHLVKLSSPVPSSYNPYYNGWDRSGSSVSTAVGIHHPAGDIKKISFDDDPLTTTSYLSNTSSSNGNHWRVETWERNTTTEGGSSGSPLFDQNHRIIGQLHGGYAACGNTSSDWYGALEASWSGLSSYLDPAGTGSLTVNGWEPGSGPAPTCSDGIQNQGETGVDCGGPCTACACNGTNVILTLNFDNYPEETSWTISQNGNTLASGGTYGNQADGSTLNLDFCLPEGCYDFTINDSYGDGICCSYGSGSYSLSGGSGTLASGGSFGSSETTNFCVGGSPSPTCNDGIQNQGETGIDCGGPCTACASCNDGIQNQGESGIDCGGPCSACPTCNDGIQNQGESGIDCGGPCEPCNTGGCTETTANFHDFEANWGIWNDGGSDCRRSANDANYSWSGSRSARLRDNTSTSNTTTDNLDMSSFEDVTVDFYFYARSMENGEDFWLQYSTNGGSSYSTVASYARGTNFENNQFYSASVDIDGPFTSTTKFRFRCDASGNSDWVYIDDVNISGCSNGNLMQITEENVSTSETDLDVSNRVSLDELNLYPNPTEGDLMVDFNLQNTEQLSLIVTDLQGRIVKNEALSGSEGMNQYILDTSSLEKGTYLLLLHNESSKITKRFVVL